MYKILRNLLGDIQGNTSLLLAVAIVPLLLAAGSAVDYLRYSHAKTSIQAAVDGAAIAAALPNDINDAKRVEIAESYFAKNLAGSSIESPTLSVTITADAVTASAKAVMATSLMRLAGINLMEIKETSEVLRPFAGQAEVVLVLDYSGSMKDNNKYQRMSAAAVRMIDALDAGIADGKLKVGLVPFSSMVYTSMPADYVTQPSGSSIWTGCTQDRKYPQNTTVDTPTSSAATKWGYFDNTYENTGQYSCAAYPNRGLKVAPLTADLSAVKQQLTDMSPLGNTNIALGAEFGWNLLDPALPYDEALPYNNKTNRKFLVLLTDGVQTSMQWGPGQTRNVTNAEPNLLALCASMRNSKITVFTIAYDVTDPAVTTMLSSCSPSKYFEPDVAGGEISAVFAQITKQIQNRVARLAK